MTRLRHTLTPERAMLYQALSKRSINTATAFHKEITEAIAELHAFMERDDASGFFYWNRATGLKATPADRSSGLS